LVIAGSNLGAELQPTLTTVHVPAIEMGRKAGHMLLGRLSNASASPGRHDLGFSLVLRESARRTKG